MCTRKHSPILGWLWLSVLTLFITTGFAEADRIDRTFAMVKPDGVRSKHIGAIKEDIKEAGFIIRAEKIVHLNESTAEAFYAEHSKRSFFPSLIDFMTSGPVLAMVLEKPNALTDWRALIGPTDPRKARVEAPNSTRAKYGMDNQNNCVHGSDSQEAAAREVSLFFKEDLSGIGNAPTHEDL